MKQSASCLTILAALSLVGAILFVGFGVLAHMQLETVVAVAVGGLISMVVFWGAGDVIDLLAEIAANGREAAANGKRQADALEELAARRRSTPNGVTATQQAAATPSKAFPLDADA